MTLNPLVIIPARMAASRLPGKPLADIHGRPMIVHVLERAKAAGVGPVLVAADAPEIVGAVKQAGGQALLTRADHPSGSDRILEALLRFDPAGHYNAIVNIQGDLPTLDPKLPFKALRLLEDEKVDIATLAAEIRREEEKTAPQVVKVVGTHIDTARLRALYFTRSAAPYGEGPLYHHIGLYAYRREALETFCSLKPSKLEQREKLEQLRALEYGLRIDVALVDTVPLGVDTPEDLERARKMLA